MVKIYRTPPNQKSWPRQCHIVISFARRVKSVINQHRSATCARLQTTFIIITSHAVGPIIIIAHFAAVKDPLIYPAATRTFSPCHPELSPVILTFEYFLRKGPRVKMKLHDSCQVSTLCLKNTRHQTLAHNFPKCWPIFKILSRADSLVNLQQNRISLFHHTLNMSLVKYECQKTGGNRKYVLWLMINHKVVYPSI